MKRKLLILLYLLPFTLFAQQWVQFSQQDKYSLYLNPAMSGYDSQLSATLAHRSQYVGLANKSIATQYLDFSTPIGSEKVGAGIRVVNDIIGFQRFTTIELNGAYHLAMGKSKLSFGLGLGFANLSVDGTKLRAVDGNYQNGQLIHNDESIPNEKIGGLNFTSAFGVHYSIADFSAGIAIQNINSPKISLSLSEYETNVYIGRTINMYGGYVIEVQKMKVTPFVSYKTDFVEHQAAMKVMLAVNKIDLSVGYRGFTANSQDAVMGEFGFKIKQKVRVGYSYDYNLSFLNDFNSGSHELSIKYIMPMQFSTRKQGNTWYNPRFL
ncbi:MAG: PorP/SprF family type IX secretion system membrane protein [Chitinophagales bacterium]